MSRKVRMYFSVLSLGLLLVGCADLGLFKPKPPEEVVKQRAGERWRLLVAGNLKDAYEYLSPGVRETRTFEQYSSRIKLGLWRAGNVKSVACKNEKACDVVVLVDYVYAVRGDEPYQGRSELTETWIKEADSWWFFPQR